MSGHSLGAAIEPIGLAGCGRMGRPMLAALRAAGFDAAGFDIRPVDTFGDAQSAIVPDVARFAGGLQTLITVVRDEAETEALLFDDQALLSKAHTLKRLIICSTLSPPYIMDLADRLPQGVGLIDAPMSGAVIAAEECRLSFMLGGEDAELDRAQPLFDAMGASCHRMGPIGAGMRAKVLNNLLAASHTVLTRQVLDWAADPATGPALDHRAFLALVAQSSGQNWLASGFDTIEFAQHGWEADNSIAILEKDVAAALTIAPHGADTRLARLIKEAVRALEAYEPPAQ